MLLKLRNKKNLTEEHDPLLSSRYVETFILPTFLLLKFRTIAFDVVKPSYMLEAVRIQPSKNLGLPDLKLFSPSF